VVAHRSYQQSYSRSGPVSTGLGDRPSLGRKPPRYVTSVPSQLSLPWDHGCPEDLLQGSANLGTIVAGHGLGTIVAVHGWAAPVLWWWWVSDFPQVTTQRPVPQTDPVPSYDVRGMFLLLSSTFYRFGRQVRPEENYVHRRVRFQ